MSTIRINGDLQEVEFPLTVKELMLKNKVVQPEMVSVQLNGDFVLSEHFNTTLLKESDELDFLYFMGGGAH